MNLINASHRQHGLKKSVNDRKYSVSTKNINSKTYDSILELIGNTPLVKLNKIPKDHGLSCEIYAKCEFMNPGGSIKDRIALAMLRDAQNNGVVHPNTTLVEPTSGNTGIGIAFNCAISGNKCIIVTEEKNSDEKVNTTRLLGSEVIQVKNNKEEIDIAHKLREEMPDFIMLNQFDNAVNPKTHYDHTGAEILDALSDIDVVVMGAGTGGTLSGAGKRIKEQYPNCKIIAAEPDGSTMINKTGKAHDYLVEGIGGTLVPIVLDKSIIDEVEVSNDEESFLMARELSRKEGLLCGGSSGTAMVCAIKAAKRLNLGPQKRVVVILPDGIRNYMTKFVSEQWMESLLYMDPPEHNMSWWNRPVTELTLKHKYPIIQNDYTCAQALDVMNDNLAVVVDNDGHYIGVVSKDSFRKSATNPTKLPGEKSEDFNFDDVVTDHLAKHVHILAKNGKKGMPTIGRLSRTLDITPFVVVGINCHTDADKDYFVPEFVASGDDVLDYIFANWNTGVPKRNDFI